MDTGELTLLLTRMAVVDGRDVDDLTIEAWEPLIGDLEYADAVQGLNEHYKTDPRRPTAAEIRTGAADALRRRMYADAGARNRCIPHRHTLAEAVGSCRAHHWDEGDHQCAYGCKGR